MKPIIFHTEAFTEMEEACAFYESRRPGLGGDCRSELEQAFARIQQHPKAFTMPKDQKTRKCIVRRFPYTIFFTEFDDRIWVAAVSHQRRRPDYWANRDPDDVA